MSITTACIIAFSISLFILAGTIVLGIVIKHCGCKSHKAVKSQSVFTPFKIFVLGFFFASVIVAYPVFYFFDFAGDAGVVRFFKSVFLSVVNTLQTFFLNADFTMVKSTISDSGLVQSAFATAYTLYASALYVIAPFLTFGFILSFFKDTVATLKYALYPSADIYILSELNERSVVLAHDIMTNGGKGRKLVVFTDVYEKDGERIAELVAEANGLGAVCLKKDIAEIWLKRAKKNYKRKVYLIGDDEDENLMQALAMIDRCRLTPRYNNYDTQFFVFANSAASEVFLDSIDNGKMKVRRITEYHNTILNMLRTHSIFEPAVQKGDKKVINIVIVGMGLYGTELLKTVCWLGQMSGYVVNVHTFDKDCAEEKIKSIAPEFYEMRDKSIEGEPYYNIIFHDKTDIGSSAFISELAAINNVTSAYVALGNDEMNIETAMKMRMLFGREKIKSGENIPEIYAIVYNTVKMDVFKRYGGLKSISGEGYNIELIDGVGSRYSLEVIEQTALEEEGLKCHLKWSKTSEQVEENKEKYERYEYFRKSSIAESAHKEMMIKIGLYKTDEAGKVSAEIAECEHKRWSAYIRSEGYVFDEKVKDDIAKTHYDLKPYLKISEEDRKKDYVVKS